MATESSTKNAVVDILTLSLQIMMTANPAYVERIDGQPTPQNQSSAAGYYSAIDDATIALEPNPKQVVDPLAAASDYAEHTYAGLNEIRAAYAGLH